MNQQVDPKLKERVIYFLKLLKTIKSKRITRWSVEDLRNAVKWAKLIEKQLKTTPAQVLDDILIREDAEVDSLYFRNSRKLLWDTLLENPAVAKQLIDSMFSVSEELEETEESFLQVLAEHVSKSCCFETCYWTMQKEEHSISSWFYLERLVDLLCSNNNSDVPYHSFFGTSPPPDSVICSNFVNGFYQSLAYGDSILVQEQQYFKMHGSFLLEQKWKEMRMDSSLLYFYLSALLVVHEKRSEIETNSSHSMLKTESIQFYSQLERKMEAHLSFIFSNVECLEQNPILCSKVAEYFPWFSKLLIPYLLDCFGDTLRKCQSVESLSDFTSLALVIQRVANMLQLVIMKKSCFSIVVQKLRSLLVDIPDMQRILKRCIELVPSGGEKHIESVD